MSKFFFEVTQTEEDNYLVILYKDGKEVNRNCLGNHRYALNWGQRTKKRYIDMENKKGQTQNV